MIYFNIETEKYFISNPKWYESIKQAEVNKIGKLFRYYHNAAHYEKELKEKNELPWL